MGTNAMKTHAIVVVGVLAACLPAARAEELVYQGAWNTTSKLDGVMTCVATQAAGQELKGRFSGTWQGAPFDYTVGFKGPPNDLRGTAMIDGVAYACRASISKKQFKANFAGGRYSGSFDLRRVEKTASRSRAKAGR